MMRPAGRVRRIGDLLWSAAPKDADERPLRVSGGDRLALDERVVVDVGGALLAGRVMVPERATGVVVFAHAGSNSRFSPCNRFLAAVLNDAGLGTVLFDLLTSDEELDRAKLFAIAMLAGRLSELTRRLRREPTVEAAGIGYLGAGTAAAAALWAAAEPGAIVRAVVCRAGRPDLASTRLPAVRAPTLLIVGGHHGALLNLNQRARTRLCCENRLIVVPGATHLLDEPGAATSVAELAREWFIAHLAPLRA
ncbi:hypothetical protein [Actinoallomurus sp. NPDC050550]|uniref:hypothetical protein n=1 Tax=Actinoallomurus sp. NPDC050550 TaxID=3154937 RepID=UPI0033FD57DA